MEPRSQGRRERRWGRRREGWSWQVRERVMSRRAARLGVLTPVTGQIPKARQCVPCRPGRSRVPGSCPGESSDEWSAECPALGYQDSALGYQDSLGWPATFS